MVLISYLIFKKDFWKSMNLESSSYIITNKKTIFECTLSNVIFLTWQEMQVLSTSCLSNVEHVFFEIYFKCFFGSNESVSPILTTAKPMTYTQFNYSDVYYVLHNEIWTLIFSSYMLHAGCNYSHRYLFIWWILLLLHSLINMEISQNLLYIQ